MRSVRILVVLAVGVSICGCAAFHTRTSGPKPPAGVLAVAPGAEKVTVTTNASLVANCVAVGDVFTLSSAGTEELKNLAVGLHADVVLLTARGVITTKASSHGNAEGVAYRCNTPAFH